MIEIWKDIQGYEGCYQVSNLGVVRSLDRFVRNGNGEYFRKGSVLAYSLACGGYPRVSLNKSGKSKDKKIHRLVAEVFIPNDKNLVAVNHIDGNKLNNRVDNLEWVSYSENMKHSFRNKTHTPGANRKKLSDRDVIEIRRWKATTNITYADLAKHYGVNPANVCNIVKNKARTKAYGLVK